MSRSYKKNPIVKDHDSGKIGKKMANRKVRKYKETIPNGKAYRKIYESYDIHDCIFRYPLSQMKRDLEIRTKEALMGIRHFYGYQNEHEWARDYKRK